MQLDKRMFANMRHIQTAFSKLDPKYRHIQTASKTHIHRPDLCFCAHLLNFSLLKTIGEGTNQPTTNNKSDDAYNVKIPHEMIVNDTDKLIQSTFTSYTGDGNEQNAILAPRNDQVT